MVDHIYTCIFNVQTEMPGADCVDKTDYTLHSNLVYSNGYCAIMQLSKIFTVM